MAYKWDKAQEAESHYGVSRSTLDRWAKLGKIGKSKIGRIVNYELVPLNVFHSRYAENPVVARITPRGIKQTLDIPIEDYIKGNLKGDDSAMSKNKRRWNFGRKGVWRRPRKKGDTWYYWYYEEEENKKDDKTEKKRKWVSVPDATCLEDVIIEMELKVEQVRQKKHKVKFITLKEFAPIYLDKYAEPKKNSYETDKGYIEGRLIPYFGETLLTEVTKEHVSDFVINFKPKVEHIEKAQGSTINKHLQVLSRMYTIAAKFGYETGENPVDRELHFADESQYRRKRVLSYEEEERLMKEAAPHLRPIIQCALLQAMRLQEILRLRVSDVDLESQLATITIRPENNKTGKEDIIPVRSEMKQIFMRLIDENGGRSKYMFNYEEPWEGGKYRNITTCRRSFREACRRANIEGFQFRDLRRTCSTRQHEAHIDPLLIQRFLRHSSFRMTGTVYIQSSMKMMSEALNKKEDEPISSQNLRQVETNPLLVK